MIRKRARVPPYQLRQCIIVYLTFVPEKCSKRMLINIGLRHGPTHGSVATLAIVCRGVYVFALARHSPINFVPRRNA